MSKRKKHPRITPWLSARPDCREGRFIQPGNSLFMSKRFQALSVGARYLYFCMAMESGGKKDFTFPQAAALKYGFARTSLRRYIAELSENGFISVVSLKNLRKPNEYSFSLSWRNYAELPAEDAPSGYI